MSYYKLNGTFTFFKVGFGVQDIMFEEKPTYCSLFYSDSRVFHANLVLESNSKPCSINWLEAFSQHWSSHEESTEDPTSQIES